MSFPAIAFSWALMIAFNPHVKKLALHNMSDRGLGINTYKIVFTLFAVLLTLLIVLIQSYDWTKLKKVNGMDVFYIVATAALSIGPSFLFLWMLRDHEVASLNFVLRPLAIMSTAAIGVFMFGESLTLRQIIGGCIILIGIGMFLYNG